MREDKELIERVAGEICRADAHDFESLALTYHGRQQQYIYRNFARAAIAECFRLRAMEDAPVDTASILAVDKYGQWHMVIRYGPDGSWFYANDYTIAKNLTSWLQLPRAGGS